DEARGKGEIPLDLIGQTRMALRAELILLASIEPQGIHDVLAGRSLHVVPAGSVTGLAADTERRIGPRPVSTRGIFRGGETGGVTAIAFRVADLHRRHLGRLLRASVRRAVGAPPIVAERPDAPLLVRHDPA